MGQFVGYIDRVNLSVATPSISKEFGLTIIEMGFLAAAFNYLYTIFQIPMGGLLDRYGVKRVLRVSTISWAFITLCTGFVNSLAALTGLRILLGAAESPGLTANSKATGNWFAVKERTFATSMSFSMIKFASVVGVPLISLIIVSWGWRYAFYFSAMLSLVYSIFFWVMYREPRNHPKITKEELTYIEEGGSQTQGVASGSFRKNLVYLLKQRRMWGLTLGYSCYGYILYLFLTWLPTYLVKELHMPLLKSGLFTAIPYIGATISCLFVGWLVDYLIRKGKNPSVVQKSVLIGGMILGLTVLFATQTKNPIVAITWITIAMVGVSPCAPTAYAITSIIAPKGMVATAGGILNFASNIMGILAPIITGFIVHVTGSFNGGFQFAALVILIGIFFYIFLLDKIEPIPDRTEQEKLKTPEYSV